MNANPAISGRANTAETLPVHAYSVFAEAMHPRQVGKACAFDVVATAQPRTKKWDALLLSSSAFADFNGALLAFIMTQ